MFNCPTCGGFFWPERGNQEYCSRACSRHAARTKSRANAEIQFIAIDGESRPDGDTNKYHILSVGDETLYRDGEALQFSEICTFLYDQFKTNRSEVDNPNKIAYVGYYLGYDFTYWLKSLPAERAKMLFHPEKRARILSGNNRVPFPVEYLGWEFDLLGMKRFKLRPVDAREWMYICDVGPFFQCSFLKAIDPSKWPVPVCTAEEYAIIVEGKTARGQETQSDKDMIKYNLLENTLLSRLMDRMREGYQKMEINIPARNWYGPGAAVSVWLNNIAAPIAIQRKTDIEDALRASYYGGRFEITAHGPVGDLYEYDINSAYPDAMSQLPMEGGKWVTEGNLDDEYCLVHALVYGANQWLGSVPHREPSGKSVCYPKIVQGWYWAHELKAAHAAGLIADMQFTEVYRYIPPIQYKPFHELRTLYKVRIEVGKETPQGKAIKLVYNSGYGKVAQSVGQPKYANVLYASLITSHCRTKILQAIATHPQGAEAVAMIATDGIYFTSPHPNLNLSDTELGAWGYAKRADMFLIKPGVYFDGEGKVKTRGIGNRDMYRIREKIRKTWDEHDWSSQQWPTFQIVPDFLVISPRAASHRGTWDLCGAISKEPFTHSFDPHTKRYFQWPLVKQNGIIRTEILPITRAAMKAGKEVVESTPYDKRFGVALMEPGDAAESGLISKTEGETIPMV